MSNPEPTGSPDDHPDGANPADFPSNRVTVPPRLNITNGDRWYEAYLGVDMVKISFPIVAPEYLEGQGEVHPEVAEGEHPSPSGPVLRDTTGFSFNLAGMDVFVWTYMAKGKLMASVRYNPARHALNPRGWGGCPINLLPVISEQVWWEIQNYVGPTVALSEAQVTRLDVNRDFTVTPAERTAILKAASSVPVPYATRRTLWLSTQGIPETLYATTKRQGGVKGYDHHARHHISPPGTFRVEAQVHRDRLNRAGITRVADLGPSTIGDLYLERFMWSGFGTPVVFTHARTKQIWDRAQDPTDPLTPLQAVRLLGRDCLLDAGIKPPEGNSNGVARRALRRSIGVPHLDPSAPVIIRLHPAHHAPLRVAA
ncbi:MAG: hypothetical protein ACR2MB_15025 [Acidimicrobiales bacterium]